jgi:hypothetical protein
MNARWTIVILLALAPKPIGAQSEASPAIAPGEVRIQGIVVDRTTGAAVEAATILLRSLAGDRTAVRISAGDGSFRFASIRRGSYEIEISRIGYQDVRVTVGSDDGALVELEVGMVPSAVELEPMVVTTARRDRLEWVGFRERQRTTTGRFFTRDEIVRHRVVRVSQLFQGVAGFRVIPSRDGNTTAVVGRGNCQPTIYLDGIRMANLGAGQLDQLLVPDHVEGLEVYSGSQTPGQFQAGRCGTIVAWTHTPTGIDSHPLGWRRFLVAGGLASAILFLMF